MYKQVKRVNLCVISLLVKLKLPRLITKTKRCKLLFTNIKSLMSKRDIISSVIFILKYFVRRFIPLAKKFISYQKILYFT